MPLIIRTVMVIVIWEALGFFTAPGTVSPLSVDLFVFCRNFRGEKKTAIEIYKSHNFPLIKKLQQVIEKKFFLKI